MFTLLHHFIDKSIAPVLAEGLVVAALADLAKARFSGLYALADDAVLWIMKMVTITSGVANGDVTTAVKADFIIFDERHEMVDFAEAVQAHDDAVELLPHPALPFRKPTDFAERDVALIRDEIGFACLLGEHEMGHNKISNIFMMK